MFKSLATSVDAAGVVVTRSVVGIIWFLAAVFLFPLSLVVLLRFGGDNPIRSVAPQSKYHIYSSAPESRFNIRKTSLKTRFSWRD